MTINLWPDKRFPRFEQGNTPIIVGGSGLYLQAVLYDYRFEGKKRLLDDVDVTLSNADLQNRLREINPVLADTIHQNNRRRLIRALEIAKFKRSERQDECCSLLSKSCFDWTLPAERALRGDQ